MPDPKPPRLPPLPESCRCETGWPNIVDCPAQRPRTARHIATLSYYWAPGHECIDVYYLSTNRSRSHWILWPGDPDKELDRYVSMPYAACPKPGVSQETAAAHLLLATLRCGDKGERWHEETPGLVGEEELQLIARDLWPPILLHIPHASTHIPGQWIDIFTCTRNVLQRELRLMTDHFVDELFVSGSDGPRTSLSNVRHSRTISGSSVARLAFSVSRLLVDPERFRDDGDEPMATRGMGAVYTRTHDGRVLKPDSHREDLLDTFYDPHHDDLERWTARALRYHHRCLIIDCHSFPSEPLPCDVDQTTPRPDLCIGTSSFHTQPGLKQAALQASEKTGLSVGDNTPYSGTIVPQRWLEQDPRVSSIMIEVNRLLYLDEGTADRLRTFPIVRREIDALLQAIVDYWESHEAIEEEEEALERRMSPSPKR